MTRGGRQMEGRLTTDRRRCHEEIGRGARGPAVHGRGMRDQQPGSLQITFVGSSMECCFPIGGAGSRVGPRLEEKDDQTLLSICVLSSFLLPKARAGRV